VSTLFELTPGQAAALGKSQRTQDWNRRAALRRAAMQLRYGSLDGRRELAIEVRDDDVVDRLHKVARHDWEHSHPLDLSDEGLLADLAERIEDSAELLAWKTTRTSPAIDADVQKGRSCSLPAGGRRGILWPGDG
jgi:hypothetical protein